MQSNESEKPQKQKKKKKNAGEKPENTEKPDKKRKSEDSVDPKIPVKKTKKGQENGSDLSFADKLRENLKGSRFRFLNEQMYKTKGSEAQKLFKTDSTAFGAYHEGYRHQISQWPMNPLDRIINGIKRMPKNYVVVDMGCGDARLSKSVFQKVYSLDLVAAADGVIECDMAKTPLETNSVNAVVYCLSLMGTNLKDFFLEANRILKIGGIIKIAEVSSRIESIDKFVEFVEKCGFELVSKDLSHNLFYFVNFKKTADVNERNKKIPDYSLKPCLYKKR
jgi:ribosomal RNA-processing protein 8